MCVMVNLRLASIWAKAAREAEDAIDLSRFPLKLQVQMQPEQVGVTIVVRMESIDRDAPAGSSKRARFQADDGVSHEVLERHVFALIDSGRAKTATDARKMVLVEFALRFVRSIVLHELDECTLVNGERIYDPHDPERHDETRTRMVEGLYCSSRKRWRGSSKHVANSNPFAEAT